MYACGLRISEAAALEITAIDGPNGLVQVIGKGNKERWVPLPQPVLAELRRLWKVHRNPRWLCPRRDGKGPTSRMALWRTFQAAVREAGITRRVSPHSLRHGYATRLLEGCRHQNRADSAWTRQHRDDRRLYAFHRADASLAQGHSRRADARSLMQHSRCDRDKLP
jgi:integrase